MCYFICISLPQPSSKIHLVFDSEISLENADATPIGKATMGNRAKGVSYTVTDRGCSCSLIGKGHSKTTDLPLQFIESIKQLLQQTPSLAILVHVSNTNWRIESVNAKLKKLISFKGFESIFPDIEEDIRYVIQFDSSYLQRTGYF